MRTTLLTTAVLVLTGPMDQPQLRSKQCCGYVRPVRGKCWPF